MKVNRIKLNDVKFERFYAGMTMLAQNIEDAINAGETVGERAKSIFNETVEKYLLSKSEKYNELCKLRENGKFPAKLCDELRACLEEFRDEIIGVYVLELYIRHEVDYNLTDVNLLNSIFNKRFEERVEILLEEADELTSFVEDKYNGAEAIDMNQLKDIFVDYVIENDFNAVFDFAYRLYWMAVKAWA